MTDEMLFALEAEHRKCLATIDRLQKECATCCLQLLSRAFSGTIEQGFADLAEGKTDKDVLSLVIGHHMRPLGVCQRCGRPAPLTDVLGVDTSSDPDEPAVIRVCSWGCPG